MMGRSSIRAIVRLANREDFMLGRIVAALRYGVSGCHSAIYPAQTRRIIHVD
jgi:hypothetical protein